MEPIVNQNLSVYNRYGDRLELLLRQEQELRSRKQPTKTGIFGHQVDAAMQTMKFLKDRCKPGPALVIAPTGSGKTGILGLIPYLMRSKRTMVLTPSPIISQQIEKSIAFPSSASNFFEKTACFPGWNDDAKNQFLPGAMRITSSDEIGKLKHDLIIINAQKLGGNTKNNVGRMDQNPEVFERIADFFRDVDLLIVDEAHHFPAPTWLHVKNAFERINPKGHMVFITATVKRMLKGKLTRILPVKHEAYVVTKEDLEFDVIRKLSFLELPGPRSKSDGSNELKLDLVKQVRKKLQEHDEIESRFKHQALILVSTINEAHILASYFNAKRPNSAAAITGGVNARRNEIDGFKNGRYQVAIVCKMLIEGFDNPSISLCVIFRRVGSRPFFEQFLGRCLRRKRFGEGEMLDCTPAVMLTYQRFDQEKHCHALNLVVAEEFPEDDVEVDFEETLD